MHDLEEGGVLETASLTNMSVFGQLLVSVRIVVGFHLERTLGIQAGITRGNNSCMTHSILGFGIHVPYSMLHIPYSCLRVGTGWSNR